MLIDTHRFWEPKFEARYLGERPTYNERKYHANVDTLQENGMSRTYRRIRYRQMWGSDLDWVLRDSVYGLENVPNETENIHLDPWSWRGDSYRFFYKKDSHEGKKRIAKYFSDAGTHRFKEPGPSWFRNLFTQRPLRRHGKRELQKFLFDPEYEVIIEEKPPLEYWT